MQQQHNSFLTLQNKNEVPMIRMDSSEFVTQQTVKKIISRREGLRKFLPEAEISFE